MITQIKNQIAQIKSRRKNLCNQQPETEFCEGLFNKTEGGQ